jgi:hypothetical protein
MDYWLLSIWIYLIIAILTFLPVIKNILMKVPLNPGGASFDGSEYFSDKAKKRLNAHYSRLDGTLGFWKKRAVIYTSFHYYCVIWTILSAWAVPLLEAISPQVEGSNAKWLLVVRSVINI